ncbi:MAG: hypothetical protein IT267_05685 [Saprospiraceae bacterium]|nr:hypothetical protein [Saprospiraceae bacterium]
MKNILIFLLLTQTLIAQTSEVNQQMSLGPQSGIRSYFDGVNAKYIEKVWKKFSKDFGKLKENKKADEFYITNATIQVIRTEPLDLYARILNNEIVVFFDLKNGFLNSRTSPEQYKLAENLITEFNYEVQREVVRDELAKESELLAKFRKNMDKLKKDNNDYHKDIEVAKAKIKKAEDNIVTNLKDQQKTETEIINQTQVIDKVQIKLNSIGKSK